MKIEQYKCQNCGGIVRFDSASGALLCLSCKTVFAPDAFELPPDILTEVPDLDYADFEPAKFKVRGTVGASGAQEEYFDFEITKTTRKWNEEDLRGLCGGSCPSCGAEFFGNENTVAAVCQCCGNAEIVVGRLRGDLKPDCIIPFKLEKEAAVAAMKEFCKGKPLLPKSFLSDNRVSDMQGIYAPFWLYDAKATGSVCYYATEDYGLETRTFALDVSGSIDFDRIPVDASRKMEDDYMDAIEPFDYREMAEFNTSFLAGYAAEKYDVDADAGKPRAELRMQNTLRKEIHSAVKNSGNSMECDGSGSFEIKTRKISYGLFPVWVFNTKYRGKSYRFMMNGQTGQLAGRLPTDKVKVWGYGGALAGVMGTLLTFATLDINSNGLLALMPLLFIVLWGMAAWAKKSLPMTLALGVMIALLPLIIPALVESWYHILLPIGLALAWATSIFTSVRVIQKLQRKMDTAREKTRACGYTVPGSFRCSL